MIKKILIVNWGTQSSDYAFRVAKEKGLDIYLASSSNYPKWIPLYIKRKNIIITNTYDSERLIIDVTVFMTRTGIVFDSVTTFFEMNVIQTADLANALGYKFLPPEVARRTSGNKLIMKNCCLKNNIPTPTFSYFSSKADGFKELKKIGTPAIIKPVRSGHGYGLKYINSLEKAKFFQFVEEAKSQISGSIDEWMNYNGPYRGDFLIEEYVEGDVISVDGLVQDKRVMICGITKFDMSALPQFVQESVQIPVTYSKKIEKKCFDMARRVVSIMGLDNGAFHTEYRLTKYGPSLLEIAARPPGGNMTLAYKNAYGVDIIDLYLDICLGLKVTYKYHSARRVVIHRSIFDGSFGEITSVKGVDELRRKKYIKVYWSISKGDIIYPKDNLQTCVIYYQVIGKNYTQAKTFDNEVKNTFKYTVSQTPKAVYERYLK